MRKHLTLHSGERALQALKVEQCEFSSAPRFEIATGNVLGAVWVNQNRQRVWSGFRWGMVPAWWDQSHEGHLLTSARAETLAQKRAFAAALRLRRAVVPVDGFWLWHDVDESKRPFFVRAADGEPLFVAALWEEPLEDEKEARLALVTVEANRLLEPFGSRMPAILKSNEVETWLNPAVQNQRALLATLKVAPVRSLTVTATQPQAIGRAALREAEDAREALAQVYGPNFDPKKPHFATRRRHVLRDHQAAGQVFFRTRSFTQDDTTRWHPVIDIECGHVFCDCPDFRYRHARYEPDVWTPHWWCKHVARAVENCRRHGELPLRIPAAH